MRRGSKPSFIEDEGKLIGICLGSDFCAEHEWGISDIRREFGIPWDKPKTYGLARRKATVLSKKYFGFPERKQPALLLLPYLFNNETEEQVKNMITKDRFAELHMCKAFGNYPAETLAAAWSSKDFGIISTAEHREKMREIDKAIRGLDIAIFLGGARLPVFDNPGLCIAIASRIPQQYLDGWEKADKDHELLMEEDAKNEGLKQRLKAAGKSWFALSPSWLSKDTASISKVMYWLNPFEQKINNSCWATVEDLEDWIKGTGKIPKTPAQVK